MPLSDDLTLWLFGDTWLGDIRNGAHVNATIVNNTVAIQHGLLPSNAAVEFHFGKTPTSNPGPFIRPADGRGWYWIYHGVLTRQGRLPKVFESLGPGVMEYWSVKKKTSIL